MFLGEVFLSNQEHTAGIIGGNRKRSGRLADYCCLTALGHLRSPRCAAPLSRIENDAVEQRARILSAALIEICFNVLAEG